MDSPFLTWNETQLTRVETSHFRDSKKVLNCSIFGTRDDDDAFRQRSFVAYRVHVEGRDTINAFSYCEIRKRLRHSLKSWRPGKLLKGIVILYDKARPHAKINETREILKNIGRKCGITLIKDQTFLLVTSMFSVLWKNFQGEYTTRMTKWNLEHKNIIGSWKGFLCKRHWKTCPTPWKCLNNGGD